MRGKEKNRRKWQKDREREKKKINREKSQRQKDNENFWFLSELFNMSIVYIISIIDTYPLSIGCMHNIPTARLIKTSRFYLFRGGGHTHRPNSDAPVIFYII